MSSSHLNDLEVNLSFLLCSVFTLLPEATFFRQFVLKKQVAHVRSGRDYFILHDSDILSLYPELNNVSLRRFAFILLDPLLRNGPCENFTLLVQFLKKFKYNYKRYFLIKNKNYSNPPTSREINTSAIKTLYLLSGI